MNYDLFAHLHNSLASRSLTENNEEFCLRFVRYKTNRNLGEISRSMLNLHTLSPGSAWQVGEVAFALFSNRAAAVIPNTLESRDAKEARKAIKDSRPVWGFSGQDIEHAVAAFPTLDEYTGDSDSRRRAEALLLPPLCFRMRITVPMNSPIVIKGDRPFVSNENPFCTEKVTGWPILRPSSLKGQARHAALAVPTETPESVDVLFGAANEDEESGSKGRVEFLPAYLKAAIEPDFLAPHDETTRRIDTPVTLEIVKAQEVILWLQYWPTDLLSRLYASGEDGIQERFFRDLGSVISALQYWFSEMGMGSKTSSGYGQVNAGGVRVELLAPQNGPWALLWDYMHGEPLSIGEFQERASLSVWEEVWMDFLTRPRS